MYTVTGCSLYFVKYSAERQTTDKRLRSCTVDCTCSDYWVCGLSVHDRKSLVTNDEGGKWPDLAPSVRKEYQQKSRSVYMNIKLLLVRHVFSVLCLSSSMICSWLSEVPIFVYPYFSIICAPSPHHFLGESRVNCVCN